jgi:hypothetical protein
MAGRGLGGGLAPRACEIHWAGLIELRGEVPKCATLQQHPEV